jgi:hypothetical protein
MVLPATINGLEVLALVLAVIGGLLSFGNLVISLDRATAWRESGRGDTAVLFVAWSFVIGEAFRLACQVCFIGFALFAFQTIAAGPTVTWVHLSINVAISMTIAQTMLSMLTRRRLERERVKPWDGVDRRKPPPPEEGTH